MYSKTCVYCGKSFESEARNTRYCSEKCANLGKKKSVKVQKARKERQSKYASDKDVNRLIQRSYSLAIAIADQLIEHKCCMCEDGQCDGELQVHHMDVNPFNNSLDNLVWVCKKHHALIHSSLPRINFCEELKNHSKSKLKDR